MTAYDQALTYCDLRAGQIVPTSEMFTALAAHGCGAIASFVAMCDAVDCGDLEYLPDEHGRMGYRISQKAMDRRAGEVAGMVNQ
jgi:hypothetical protein